MLLLQEVAAPGLIDRISDGDPVLILLLIGFGGLVSALVWVAKQWVNSQARVGELLKTTLETLKSLDLHSEGLSRDIVRLESRLSEVASDLKSHITSIWK